MASHDYEIEAWERPMLEAAPAWIDVDKFCDPHIREEIHNALEKLEAVEREIMPVLAKAAFELQAMNDAAEHPSDAVRAFIQAADPSFDELEVFEFGWKLYNVISGGDRLIRVLDRLQVAFAKASDGKPLDTDD